MREGASRGPKRSSCVRTQKCQKASFSTNSHMSEMRKPRPREGKKVARGNTASRQQRLKPGRAAWSPSSQAGSASLRLPRPAARRPEPGASHPAIPGAARYLAGDWAPRASSPPAGRWRLCPAGAAGGPGVGPQLSAQGGACGSAPEAGAEPRANGAAPALCQPRPRGPRTNGAVPAPC